MKRKNSELVGSGCSGECRIVYGSIRDFASEVGIRSVRKRQINVRTDEPVPGTEQILPVATLDRKIRNLLRRHLEKGFVYKPASCPRGCFCNPIGISDETSAQLTYTIKLREKTTRAQVYIEKGQIRPKRFSTTSAPEQECPRTQKQASLCLSIAISTNWS